MEILGMETLGNIRKHNEKLNFRNEKRDFKKKHKRKYK